MAQMSMYVYYVTNVNQNENSRGKRRGGDGLVENDFLLFKSLFRFSINAVEPDGRL